MMASSKLRSSCPSSPTRHLATDRRKVEMRTHERREIYYVSVSGIHARNAMTSMLQAQPSRPVLPAMRMGWRRRCPSCGSGPMMRGYLKVREVCPVCGETLGNHRADDGPAYLTILIVGHMMAPLILWVYTLYRPEPLTLAAVFSVGCVAASLYLLPRLKGVIVAIQWAKYMHGFGKSPDSMPRMGAGSWSSAQSVTRRQ